MVIVDCIVLHYMHIWHLRIRASSLQFRASKINMALARLDKLVKKLMSKLHFCTMYSINLRVVLYKVSRLYKVYLKKSMQMWSFLLHVDLIRNYAYL